MSNKENFISEVSNAVELGMLQLSPAAARYFEELQNESSKKSPLTEKGIQILSFMQRNEKKYNNIFKSKDIAEGLFISSRQVSGSMQKLVKEGFCEKIGGSPVCYSLTEVGSQQELKVDNNEKI